ncbi:MAG TPA: DNA recombination protein RmuC [Candidatus Saccharimonadales bacterium]|nr:DNA recombination protein RmuC [Candidatus Saccharimonadales bacterium]
MSATLFLLVLLALLAGALVGWALGARGRRTAQAEAGELRARAAELGARLEGERQSAAEKLKLLEQAELKLREAFQALSAEALRSNNEAFLDLAQTKLGQFQTEAKGELEARQTAIAELVKPVAEALKKVDEQIKNVEKERVGHYKELATQVQAVAQTEAQLKAETANLVKALRTPSARGQWGELQLRKVLEMSGMQEGIHYTVQPSVATEEGRLRPDVIVRLPGGKNVVVDAKTPLEAYLNAVEAADDAARDALLKDHARRVREHMAELGRKSYWSQFDPAPEFVVMFLPGEMFFSAALQQDPQLIERGVEEKVIPASPTTLIALLRAVNYGWQQERMAESAEQISALGRELYQRLATLAGHFDRLGKSLDGAVESYNAAVGSLETRVLVAARKFEDLGAAPPEGLPEPREVDARSRQLHAPEAEQARAGSGVGGPRSG